MEQKRNRTFRNGVGLLTALTLSMGLLAGCGPKFDASPGATVPPAAGANASGLPADAVTIAGTAALSSGPLAGASIKVIDVLTGRELPIVAGGGANIVAGGAGNIVAGGAGNLTDATGNFSVSVTGLTAGSVARVVAAGSGGAMSALVGGDGVSASSKYRVNAFVVPKMKLNAASTAADRAIAPLVIMTGKLRASARLAIVRALMDRGGQLAQNLNTYYTANAAAANALFVATNPNTGIADAATVDLALTATNQQGNLQATAAEIANSVAAAGTTLSNLANTDELLRQSAEISPIGGITFTASGDLSIGGVVITLPKAQTPAENPSQQPTTGGTTPAGSNQPPVQDSGAASDDESDIDPNATGDASAEVTSAAFNPGIDLSYDELASNLQVIVTQPQGAQDIGYIVARLKNTEATFIGTANTMNIGTGTADLTSLPTRTLDIVQDDDASAGHDLPARFGGGQLGAGELLWQGFIRSQFGEDVATFHVYKTSLYLYLVTAYNLDPSFSLLSNGHVTDLSTGWVETDIGTKGEIVMFSRDGERVERVDVLQDGSI